MYLFTTLPFFATVFGSNAHANLAECATSLRRTVFAYEVMETFDAEPWNVSVNGCDTDDCVTICASAGQTSVFTDNGFEFHGTVTGAGAEGTDGCGSCGGGSSSLGMDLDLHQPTPYELTATLTGSCTGSGVSYLSVGSSGAPGYYLLQLGDGACSGPFSDTQTFSGVLPAGFHEFNIVLSGACGDGCCEATSTATADMTFELLETFCCMYEIGGVSFEADSCEAVADQIVRLQGVWLGPSIGERELYLGDNSIVELDLAKLSVISVLSDSTGFLMTGVVPREANAVPFAKTGVKAPQAAKPVSAVGGQGFLLRVDGGFQEVVWDENDNFGLKTVGSLYAGMDDLNIGLLGSYTWWPGLQRAVVNASGMLQVDNWDFDGEVIFEADWSCNRLRWDAQATATYGGQFQSEFLGPLGPNGSITARAYLDYTHRRLGVELDSGLFRLNAGDGTFSLGCFPLPVCGGLEAKYNEFGEATEATVLEKLELGLDLGAARQSGDERESADAVPVGIGVEFFGRESFTDENCNAEWDPGEPYEDTVFPNGQWDDGTRWWLTEQGNVAAVGRAKLKLGFVAAELVAAEGGVSYDGDSGAFFFNGGTGFLDLELAGVSLFSLQPELTAGLSFIPDGEGTWTLSGDVKLQPVALALIVDPFDATISTSWRNGAFESFRGTFRGSQSFLDLIDVESDEQAVWEIREDGTMYYAALLKYPIYSAHAEVSMGKEKVTAQTTNTFTVFGARFGTFAKIVIDDEKSTTQGDVFVGYCQLGTLTMTWRKDELLPSFDGGIDAALCDLTGDGRAGAAPKVMFRAADGRRVGADPVTGEISNEIPGARYTEYVDGSGARISLPTPDLLEAGGFEFGGEGSSTVALAARYPTLVGESRIVFYDDDVVPPGETGLLVLDRNGVENAGVDSDGDGVIDQMWSPDSLHAAPLDETLPLVVYEAIDPMPQVSGVRLTARTNVPVTSSLLFGPTKVYTDTLIAADTLADSAVVVLEGLIPETEYHYKWVVTDSLGRTAETVDGVLGVDDDFTPVAVEGFIAVRDGQAVTLRWIVGVPHIDGFTIHRSEDDQSGSVPVGVISSTGVGPMQYVDDNAPSTALTYWVVARSGTGGEAWYGPVSVEAAAPALPNALAIRCNSMARSSTARIQLEVPTPGGRARINVYDAGGRLVRGLLDRAVSPGVHEYSWDTRSDGGKLVGSGVYFIETAFEGARQAVRVVILR